MTYTVSSGTLNPTQLQLLHVASCSQNEYCQLNMLPHMMYFYKLALSSGSLRTSFIVGMSGLLYPVRLQRRTSESIARLLSIIFSFFGIKVNFYQAKSATKFLYVKTSSGKVVVSAAMTLTLCDRCCSCMSSSSESDDSSATTTWRGVVESTDCVGLFNSTFTVSCVDRSTAVRTAKVARAGQLLSCCPHYH